MGRYDLVINGTPYRVDILEVAGTRAVVSVNGVTYHVEVPAGTAPVRSIAPPAPRTAAAPVHPIAPSASPVAPPPASATPAGGETVSAPMPGHILSVPVKAGDAVEAGDTVVVMEAMKMENEIKAHVAGKVLEVKVQKGQDVGVNEPLVVIGVG